MPVSFREIDDFDALTEMTFAGQFDAI